MYTTVRTLTSGKRFQTLAFSFGILSIPGCLAGSLRQPATDHAVQAEVIYMWCKSGKFDTPCPDDLVPMLDENAKQAELIRQAVAK